MLVAIWSLLGGFWTINCAHLLNNRALWGGVNTTTKLGSWRYTMTIQIQSICWTILLWTPVVWMLLTSIRLSSYLQFRPSSKNAPPSGRIADGWIGFWNFGSLSSSDFLYRFYRLFWHNGWMINSKLGPNISLQNIGHIIAAGPGDVGRVEVVVRWTRESVT